MKGFAHYLSLTLLAAPLALLAQSSNTSSSLVAAGYGSDGGSSQTAPMVKVKMKGEVPIKPFSEYAISGGIGVMGINLQVATNMNRYLNLRGIGNVFSYTANNININGNKDTSGIDVSGKVNFATAGVAVDYYPFPTHGLRISPGVIFYNQNQISASGLTVAGDSFTLGPQTYYSETANPTGITANLGLNARQQAFTITTGWGNMISRKGGHWAVPFEIGAAFTGAPTLNLALTGYACTSSEDWEEGGESCVNMATDPTAQANINAQIAKYRKDLNDLQVYPILSIGVSYAFHGKQ